MLSEPGWKENEIYPGTHWLYYDARGHYRARVDLCPWNNGQYEWRIMFWSNSKQDIVGREPTLEKAQKAAETVMAGKPYQMRML